MRSRKFSIKANRVRSERANQAVKRLRRSDRHLYKFVCSILNITVRSVCVVPSFPLRQRTSLSTRKTFEKK